MVVVLVVVVVTISYGGENGDDSCGGVSDGMQQKVSLSNVRNVYFLKLKTKFSKLVFLVSKMSVKMFQK